jgi:hypothetical protein
MPGKTEEQLDRDTNALIKLVLLDMEELASLPPAMAAHPYELEQRRKRVIRRIWQLVKDFKDAAHEHAGSV